MTRKEAYNKALKVLDEIEANTEICCAITMDPEEVSVMISNLRTIIEELKDEEN